MNKKRLVEILRDPRLATDREIKEIKRLSTDYSYASFLKVLRARMDNLIDDKDKSKSLSKAAIYIADRATLKNYILHDKPGDPGPRVKGVADPGSPAVQEKKIVPEEQLATDKNISESSTDEGDDVSTEVTQTIKESIEEIIQGTDKKSDNQGDDIPQIKVEDESEVKIDIKEEDEKPEIEENMEGEIKTGVEEEAEEETELEVEVEEEVEEELIDEKEGTSQKAPGLQELKEEPANTPEAQATDTAEKDKEIETKKEKTEEVQVDSSDQFIKKAKDLSSNTQDDQKEKDALKTVSAHQETDKAKKEKVSPDKTTQKDKITEGEEYPEKEEKSSLSSEILKNISELRKHKASLFKFLHLESAGKKTKKGKSKKGSKKSKFKEEEDMLFDTKGPQSESSNDQETDNSRNKSDIGDNISNYPEYEEEDPKVIKDFLDELERDNPPPKKKLKKEEQEKLIERFIQSEPELKNVRSSKEIPERKDLSLPSVKFRDDIISENLANIMIKQGKLEKAIDIYKKLIWKFPQKKTYFATQIEALKKKSKK